MKKTIAIILTLALMLAVAPATVFAAPGDPVDGGGGVEITPGDPPVIIKPEDPTYKDLFNVTSTNIDFGSHKKSIVNVVYKSLDSATEDLQYIGIGVLAEDLETAQPWYVDATVAGFKLAGGNFSIKEFTIDFTPIATGVQTWHPTLAVGAAGRLTAQAKAFSVTPEVAGGVYTGGVGEPASKVFWGNDGEGLAGIDFSGELKVPGGAVLEAGESNAVITWYITLDI